MRISHVIRAGLALLSSRTWCALHALDRAVHGYSAWLLHPPVAARPGPPHAHFLDVEPAVIDVLSDMDYAPWEHDHDFRPGDVVFFRELAPGDVEPRVDVRRLTRVQPMPGKTCILSLARMNTDSRRAS